MIIKNGLILLNKPSGITSFDALYSIKKRIMSNKIGHAGTLDKFADGLLIALAGKMTKLNNLFSNLDKQYRAVFCFGIETDTLDPEGRITNQGNIPDFSTIKDSIASFIGKIKQTPPLYSAVHVSGERAYKLARKGIEFSINEREVTIYDIKLEYWEPPFLGLYISCSKGTYIRSLARDLGTACGSRAYVKELTRISIGPYSVNNSISPEEFNPDRDIITDADCFSGLKTVATQEIKENFVSKVCNGVQLQSDFFINPPENDGLFALFDTENHFIALADKRIDIYKYIFVAGIML